MSPEKIDWQSAPVQAYLPKKTKAIRYCEAFSKILCYPLCLCRTKKRYETSNKVVRYSIRTLDHKATVDALFLRGNLEKKKAVLLSLGPDFKYQHLSQDATGFLPSLVKFIKAQLGDVHILIPNHSDISNTIRVQEIASCYEMLIKGEGFNPDDVIVYGHGIGALIGATAAAKIQNEYFWSKISVVLDRTSVALDQIEEQDGESKGHVRRKTNINIQAPVEELQGDIIAIMSHHGKTIPPEKSFAKNVKRQNIEDRLASICIGVQAKADTHFAEFNKEEANLVGWHLRRILNLPNN